jgi:hypothetical protein
VDLNSINFSDISGKAYQLFDIASEYSSYGYDKVHEYALIGWENASEFTSWALAHLADMARTFWADPTGTIKSLGQYTFQLAQNHPNIAFYIAFSSLVYLTYVGYGYYTAQAAPKKPLPPQSQQPQGSGGQNNSNPGSTSNPSSPKFQRSSNQNNGNAPGSPHSHTQAGSGHRQPSPLPVIGNSQPTVEHPNSQRGNTPGLVTGTSQPTPNGQNVLGNGVTTIPDETLPDQSALQATHARNDSTSSMATQTSRSGEENLELAQNEENSPSFIEVSGHPNAHESGSVSSTHPQTSNDTEKDDSHDEASVSSNAEHTTRSVSTNESATKKEDATEAAAHSENSDTSATSKPGDDGIGIGPLTENQTEVDDAKQVVEA